tara:strand:- start:119 stop:865 length:747 start_codon:yes stop_codon:yes gene_type:complete
MALKNINLNYSPNFNPSKRKSKQIKFLIFHYTGMRKEEEAIKRLTSVQSEVSSHYLIKNNGDVILMVPDLYIAWHAGKSSWRNYKSLNKYSIGIEINNPGHQFNYKKFSTKQINSILRLSKYLIKKYKIPKKNILGHSDIAPSRKKDPGEKFPWKYLASKKIGLWHSLPNNFLKKSRKTKVNAQEKKIFFQNLSKIGYSRNFLNDFKKKNISRLIVKAFQRKFRQELVNGIIDKECIKISNNLIKKYF